MIIDQITKTFINDQVNPLTLILGVTGFIFYVAGYIQFKYPPKKIQHLGVYSFFGGILAYFVNIDQFYGMWTGISLVTVLPILLIFKIEKELKRRFPKT